MEPGDGSTLTLDASRPNPARVRDYWLGGNESFAADREAAAAVEALFGDPSVPGRLARDERAFITRAAAWLASPPPGAGVDGITQFVHARCGLPGSPSLQAAVAEARPGAVVVLADPDQVAVYHQRILSPGVTVIRAGLDDPARVLDDAALRAVIDFTKPAAVILTGVLASLPEGAAAEAARGWTAGLPAGSALVTSTSHITCQEAADGITRACEQAGAGLWRNCGTAEVASWFAGLRLVPGQVADVRTWPMLPPSQNGNRIAAVIGGVGIVR